VVLWFFFGANDFDSLLEERQPTLRRYLERGHSAAAGSHAAVQVAQRDQRARMKGWFLAPTADRARRASGCAS
jgi:hypothetical protein